MTERVTFEVHNPSGEVEATRQNAARLGDLNGKKIGFVTSSLWEADRVLGLLKGLLQQRAPAAAFIHWDELPSVEDLDRRIKGVSVLKEKGCQAVIVGNGG
ncbi:MAG: hypothetical protein Q7T05_03450 [Dehalococcoidia bacterium]|nr:hypothetical protein [Dehalococcoidia bacterium]